MKSSLNYLKEVSVEVFEAFKNIQCLLHSTFSMTMNDILFYVIDNFKLVISYLLKCELQQFSSLIY